MKKLLIALLGALAFQGYVFAASWEERAASKTPWNADFPDDPACWNRAVEWNTVNPWVVLGMDILIIGILHVRM